MSNIQNSTQNSTQYIIQYINQLFCKINTLLLNPELFVYIQKYNKDGGFMFGDKTPEEIILDLKIECIIDEDGNHSGLSYALELRKIQDIFNGIEGYNAKELLKEAIYDDDANAAYANLLLKANDIDSRISVMNNV